MVKRKPPSAVEAQTSSDEASARKKKPRRRRSARKREEFVSYVVRVTGWDYYYAFRTSDPKSRWDSGPYSELATLSFAGDLIRPENTRHEKVTITLSARAGMHEEKILPPSTIGNLTAAGNELSAYIFIPQERFAELGAVAQSGKMRIAHLTGTKLKYRSASISNLSLTTEEEDEEDW